MNKNGNKKILLLSGVAALIFAGCALVIGIFELAVWGIASPIDAGGAGERWSRSGEPYAVISLYTEEGSAFLEDQLFHYENAVDAALVSASVSSDAGGRVWTYAYVAETVLSVTGPRGEKNAAITACGGDFFLFHPLNFLHGAAFLNDPANPGGVVIDETLAWDIFGAVDVVGMELSVGGLPLTVVGVVTAERDDHAYRYTYGELPRMYMSYGAYDKLGGETADITVVEATLPNPVKSFAMNIFKTAITVNEDTTAVRETSARFTLSERFENMKKLRYSWIRSDKIGCPYWENEARMADHTCAVLMIFEIIFASLGGLAFLLALVLFFSSGFSFVRAGKGILGWVKLKSTQRKRNQFT